MRNSIAIQTVLVSVFVSGCSTTFTHQFQGEVRNIKHDGQTEMIHGEISTFSSGPALGGGRCVGFALPMSESSVYLFYPELAPSQTLVTTTESEHVAVWLMRGSLPVWPDFKGNPEKLRQNGGEKLSGRIAVKWKSGVAFHIYVDAAADGEGSTALRGEFVGCTRIEFDSDVLWVGPAMLLFGEGGAIPQPAVGPDTKKDR